jgi:NB-ARC domain
VPTSPDAAVTDYVTNDGLLYDALFRHYRNAVVDHVRTCMQVEFGGEAEKRLEGCFGVVGWAEIKRRVRAAEARGPVRRERLDEFDFLDIANFDQVVDHLYTILVPLQWRGAQEAASKRALHLWIQEVKAARDPEAHPGDLDVEVMDAIRAVDTAQRVLRRLGTASGNEALARILQELFDRAVRPVEVGSVAPLDDSLPAAATVVEDFVGRNDELKQLRAWLRHPRQKRWMLVGYGGKGKTAIAYKFSREILEAAPPGLCAVFWLSAKTRQYKVDSIVDVATPDFVTLSECLDKILIDYGHHEALNLSLQDRQDEVMELLDTMPCLLVVDDLDSVEMENEDVIEFLTLEAARTRSKILFTSRRPFVGMGRSQTQIEGLPDEQALDFVHRRWAHTGLNDSKLEPMHRRRITEVCEGSPLFMGDLIRLCATITQKQNLSIEKIIDDWVGQEGDEVRSYALQREMDLLTTTARRILETIAIASRPMTLIEIGNVCGYREDVVAAGVEELRQLYLLSAPALDEETPRFKADGNLAILVRSDLRGSPREQKITNALAAIDGRDVGEAQTVRVRDLARQARLLLNANRLIDAEQLLQTGLVECPENPNLLSMLGFCYAAWNPRRNADARAQFVRAAQLGSVDRGMFLAWSRIEGQLGNWEAAAKAAEMGLKNKPRDPMLLGAAGEARLSLAKQHLSALSEDKARIEYENAEYLLEDAITEARRLRLRATDISRLFRLWFRAARECGHHRDACRRLEAWGSWKRADRSLQEAIAEHAPNCPTKRHKAAL